MTYRLDNIYCADCYEAIKDIPDHSIDLIYTDIPYRYEQNGQGHSVLCRRAYHKRDELSAFSDGIDYAIFDDFVRVLKKINVFIWCSRAQIFEIMKIFVEKYHCSYEILTWNKTNPTPTTNGHWLPDIEYCLYFREDGVKLNDGYDLKSKWYTSGANKSDKNKFDHPTIKPLPLVQRHIQHAVNGGGGGGYSVGPFCRERDDARRREELGIALHRLRDRREVGVDRPQPPEQHTGGRTNDIIHYVRR